MITDLLRKARSRVQGPSLRNAFDCDLIVVGTHHKTGCVLMQKVFRDVCRHSGLQYFRGRQEDLPFDKGAWIQPHSQINVSQLQGRIKGLHLTRHPFNLIISAYLFHKVCDEKWCIDTSAGTEASGKTYDIGGKTYQEHLNSLSAADGIRFEMKHRSYDAIMDMYNWDYSNEAFRNVCLDRINLSFQSEMERNFRHLGVPESKIAHALDITERHDVQKWDSRRLEQSRHVRSGGQRSLDHYKKFWDPGLYEAFWDTFPGDILTKLNYPDWSKEI